MTIISGHMLVLTSCATQLPMRKVVNPQKASLVFCCAGDLDKMEAEEEELDKATFKRRHAAIEEAWRRSASKVSPSALSQHFCLSPSHPPSCTASLGFLQESPSANSLWTGVLVFVLGCINSCGSMIAKHTGLCLGSI